MGVILVAYERESELTALEQLFTGRGHRVLKSSNGLAALDAARREPPHLVVSDIVLPRMDGFALCRKWKQDERLQSIPFIFYTRRHDDPKYERFALELGAERFLARTAQPEALAEAVDELIGKVPRSRTVASRTVTEQAPTAPSSPAQPITQGAEPQAQIIAQLKAEHAQVLERARQANQQALERAQQVHKRLQAQMHELEASQQRMAAGEARFRRVFEANPVPMWIADHATQGFIAVNEAALALYGYTRGEFLALTTHDLPAGADSEDAADLHVHKNKKGDRLLVVIESQDMEFDGRSADLVSVHDMTVRIARERDRARANATAFLIELHRNAEALDESGLVCKAVERAGDATGSALSVWYFVDAANEAMTLAAWRDGVRARATTMTISHPQSFSNAGVFGECVKARHPISGNDPSRKPQSDGLPDLQRYLAVPIVADGETVAVLGVANREAGYGEHDQRALAAIGEGAWRVLQAKRSHARTLASLQRTEIALQGTVDALVRISERHDPHTAGSSHRVAALAVALAREAGLDGERQHALRLAALLHDVGNIAVPAAILAKPSALTEHEAALMRTHPEEGCKLLAEIDFGAPVAEIIFEHHERYDGSGYPRGLKGEDICIEARILAIADTVEAMCSARPYRQALGIDAAIDEINRHAGKLYDLHLVTACTRLVRERGFVLPVS